MKKIIAFVLISTLIISLLPANANAQQQLILYPTDDTYINLFTPDMNFDGSGLMIEYSNQPSCVITSRTYLRFNLSQLHVDVGGSSKLRLYVAPPYGAPSAAGTISLSSTGDDWNGTAPGLGDQTTLTWNNAPAITATLDTQPVTIADSVWVEFSGAGLSTFINSMRATNGGNDLASFVVQWADCVLGRLDDGMIFDDIENTWKTGNKPEIVPLGPTAITLSSFKATSPFTQGWIIPVGLCLVLATTVGVALYRRRSKAK